MTDSEADIRSERGLARLWEFRELLYGVAAVLGGVAILLLVPFQTRDDSALIPLDNPALLPSFYPRVVGVLILLTGAWIVFRAVVTLLSVQRGLARRSTEAAGEDEISSLEPKTTLNTPFVVVAMAVYSVLVNTTGFRSAVLLMGFLGARWMGAPWWAAALIAVVPAIGLFAIFWVWLGVPLPASIY